MDQDSTTGRDRGGSVEPADRAAIAKARAQTPPRRGETFELRDPLNETTYRAPTMKEIVAHADRLQATRIVAVGEDGSRTPIHKIGGHWERQPTLRPHPPAPEQAVSDEAGTTAKGAGSRETAGRYTPPQPEARKPAIAPTARDELEALRAARAAEIEAGLNERYVVKHATLTGELTPLRRTEYRFRGDVQRVAFTETAFKLTTDQDHPSIARSMVDVAEARNWKALRVTGSDTFRRQVWMEATVRGVRALGYEPDAADLQVVQREREARQHNRIEPAREQASSPAESSSEGAKAKGNTGRGGGGRKAVLAALEAVLVDRKVPPKQRAAVMAAAEQNLAKRMRDGETHRVKVYDEQAPSRRTEPRPTRDPSRVPAVERAFTQPTR